MTIAHTDLKTSSFIKEHLLNPLIFIALISFLFNGISLSLNINLRVCESLNVDKAPDMVKFTITRVCFLLLLKFSRISLGDFILGFFDNLSIASDCFCSEMVGTDISRALLMRGGDWDLFLGAENAGEQITVIKPSSKSA